jgi:3-hydroxyisobutyrate dehydrogenase-like beta-hydroxyacid dehydrogenase
MGGAMSARFLSAGYPVFGEEQNREHAQELVDEGLRWCDTPREVAVAADIVFTSLPDDGVLEEVASGSDGILAGLAPEKIWVDMSTVSPRASRALAERVHALGAAMLDAPVSGSVPQVQAGTLTIMVGGDKDAYARVEPLLRELGTPTHIGENGQGLVLKLAINISLAAQMLAFSEGVLLAERAGIEPKLAMDVMTQSAIGSPMLKGARAACARPAGGRLVRRRADAKGHRARARQRTGAGRPAALCRGSRRAAHRGAGAGLRAPRPGGPLRGACPAGRRED